VVVVLALVGSIASPCATPSRWTSVRTLSNRRRLM
jgi:hypothetical protein